MFCRNPDLDEQSCLYYQLNERISIVKNPKTQWPFKENFATVKGFRISQKIIAAHIDLRYIVLAVRKDDDYTGEYFESVHNIDIL